MKSHLWQAYNPKKISVDISKELKNKIKKFIEKNIRKSSEKIKINPARLYEYFIYQNKSIPLDKLMSISTLMKLSLIDLEKQIIMYKQTYVPIKNSVKNPNLPIKVTPYFTSIVSHLFFDGSVPEDGKGTYYHQKNEKVMQDFIGQVMNVFGEVYYSLKRDHRSVLKLRLPRIIGEICKKVYKIKTFGGAISRVPRFVFSLTKENKVAFVLSAILDEGSIGYDGNIIFGVSNKGLCEDTKILCDSIGLRTSKIGFKIRENNHYYFRIISKKEFLNLILSFKKKYPLMSLNYKEERLKHYFKTLKFPGLRTKKGGEERKVKIFSFILNKEETINSLCKELLIPPRTIRRHLHNLINQGKVKRRKFKNNYLYTSIAPH